MTPELQAHVAERMRDIAVLRDLYGFSQQEAEDFADLFPAETFHVELAA